MGTPSYWTTVKAGEALTPGKYRITGSVGGAYNDALTGALALGIRSNVELHGGTWDGMTTEPPLMNAHDYKMGPWDFDARFHVEDGTPVEAGFDGKALLVIVAGVIAIALALTLVTHTLERFVEAVGDTAKKTLGPGGLSNLFSPGTLVLAFVAIFLITRARGRIHT